jgi:hypothetical protein
METVPGARFKVAEAEGKDKARSDDRVMISAGDGLNDRRRLRSGVKASKDAPTEERSSWTLDIADKNLRMTSTLTKIEDAHKN